MSAEIPPFAWFDYLRERSAPVERLAQFVAACERYGISDEDRFDWSLGDLKVLLAAVRRDIGPALLDNVREEIRPEVAYALELAQSEQQCADLP